MELNQEIDVELEPGKTLVITLDAIGDPDEEGCVTVYFSLNGHPRQVEVRDRYEAQNFISRDVDFIFRSSQVPVSRK